MEHKRATDTLNPKQTKTFKYKKRFVPRQDYIKVASNSLTHKSTGNNFSFSLAYLVLDLVLVLFVRSWSWSCSFGLGLGLASIKTVLVLVLHFHKTKTARPRPILLITNGSGVIVGKFLVFVFCMFV